RDFQRDHCWRADRRRDPRGWNCPVARAYRRHASEHQHLRRLRRHRADAWDVQEEREEGLMEHAATTVPAWVALSYLVAGILFILALRGLSSPESSRRGNRLGMAGMAIAVIVT